MSSPLSDALGDFLAEFHWDWFVTLTFEGDVKTFTAHNRCASWLRSLEKAAGQPIAWFRGDEYGEKFGKFHIHLLIANVANLHRFTWMERWAIRNGYARIFPFDPKQGAAHYVGKYVSKQFGDWDLSGNINSFRIQQATLPLMGQKGSPKIAATSPAPITRKSNSRIPHPVQVPLGDFKHPDLREFDGDEIRSDFRDKTRRKR